MVGDLKVRVSADPPHLLKNLRNAFQQFDFVLSDETVRQHNLVSNLVQIRHIKDLYEFDCTKEMKYAPKLTSECFDVHGLAAMNVPRARKIFSQDVGAGLRAMVEIHNFSKEYLTTALFCNMVGRWYNLVTSRNRKFSLSLKDFRKYEEEVDFLKEMMELIGSTKFSASQKNARHPFQKGFLMSTMSLLEVVDFLLRVRKFHFVMCGRMTCDCIENLFSSIRLRAKAPTCLQTKSILRTLTIIKALRPSKFGAYEEDEKSTWLIEIKDFKDFEGITFVEEKEEKDLDIFVGVFETRDYAEQQVVTYVTGHLLKRTICTNSYCPKCVSAFTDPTATMKEQDFILMKAWKDGSLVIPSQIAYNIFSMVEDTFRIHRDKINKEKDVIEQMIDSLDEVIRDKYDIPFCHLELMLKRWFNVRMHFWANESNRLMKDDTAQQRENLGQANASQSMKGYYLNK